MIRDKDEPDTRTSVMQARKLESCKFPKRRPDQARVVSWYGSGTWNT